MNDALSTSMFWVGAMFAFTPIVVGGTVVAIIWWKRRQGARADQPDPGTAQPGR